MAETKKEYLVMVQQRYQQKEGKHSNLAAIMGGFGKRCYGDLERAKADLRKFIEQNDPSKKVYGKNGKRYESCGSAGGLGMSIECDKDTDRDMEVVDWYIKEREVTPWVKLEVDL